MEHDAKYKKILVRLDGSEITENALPYAQELAIRFGAQMILFRVVRPINNLCPHIAPYGLIKEAEELALKFAKYLESIVKVIRNDGLVVKTEVIRGTPQRGILK